MKKAWVIRCGNLYLTSMGWLDLRHQAEKYHSLTEALLALVKTIRIFPRLEKVE
jgi:hypothetical protein